MDIQQILINLIVRIVGGALGFLVAWLVQKGITIPILTPGEIDVLAGAIGVVGGTALWGGIKRLFAKPSA